nr:hypothetical protein [Actinomycetota bacterium]
AADLGTAIHEAVEAYVLGKPMPPWSDAVAPRMRQFERFLADYSPEYEATEASVYNRTERYAGTLDAIALVGGRKLVLDTKTGKALYPEVGLQLAAYRHAEFIGLADGSEGEMPETDGAAGLHLADDDYAFLDVQADAEVFRTFRYAREIFRWTDALSKGVIRGPVPFPGSETQESLDLAKAMGE